MSRGNLSEREVHSFQVWDFTIIKNETRLVTGCADSELRVWEIKYRDESTADDEKKRKLTTHADPDDPEETQVLSFSYDFFEIQNLPCILCSVIGPYSSLSEAILTKSKR